MLKRNSSQYDQSLLRLYPFQYPKTLRNSLSEDVLCILQQYTDGIFTFYNFCSGGDECAVGRTLLRCVGPRLVHLTLHALPELQTPTRTCLQVSSNYKLILIFSQQPSNPVQISKKQIFAPYFFLIYYQTNCFHDHDSRS